MAISRPITQTNNPFKNYTGRWVPFVRSGDVPKGSGKATPEMAAEAYVKCVEGDFTGQTIRAWNMD